MNYYDLLGIRQDAHPVEIDAAYKMLSNQQDVNYSVKLTLKMAHQTLMSPTDRHGYDLAVSSGQGHVQFLDEMTFDTYSETESESGNYQSVPQLNPRSQNKQDSDSQQNYSQAPTYKHWADKRPVCESRRNVTFEYSSPPKLNPIGSFFLWFFISYCIAMCLFSVIGLMVMSN